MKRNNMAKEVKKQNKGEWTESYVFFKLILNNILLFGDENQSATSESVTVKLLAEMNSDHYLELRDGEIQVISNNGIKLFHILIYTFFSSMLHLRKVF